MQEINNQEQQEQAKDVEETQQNEEVVEEKTYSKEEVDALQEQIDELSQYKPKELTDDEIKIQQKLEAIWQREVSQTLKEEGVEVFADFINVSVDDTEALQSQITKLKEIIGQLELANGYKPTNHKQVDGYSIAKKNKDTKSMISQKLNF
ncbi:MULTISPECIES: xanthine phosphoribosyltransferase [Bacillus cereus group]|uniref:xanthine phosphoribosyltransferase n=1 Tax=Bacillus cereus group TaxID=86661 RepID=UPI0009375E4F|nr:MULTISPECIES: xanthine phosphoribosyltransferase [Bacillus cereus group]OKA30805.1 xanthine phosphoribosyltransferase [Bacillus cereus]PEM38320.1 xanthine phosphoribosyltransferase [Bacillus toyonensis]PGR77761.1 xanthine phosphoribosyltransferase [Bacillus thuringiensis]